MQQHDRESGVGTQAGRGNVKDIIYEGGVWTPCSPAGWMTGDHIVTQAVVTGGRGMHPVNRADYQKDNADAGE